jgi:hypothetical protein
VVLPPRQVAVLEATQTAKLDDLRLRPDLAVTTREVRAAQGKVTVTVHNIGGGDAPAFTVALVDADGKTRTSQEAGALPAPLDLQPKRATVTLTAPEGNLKGWTLVVDPGNEIPELYEANNSVAVP